jgi:hypothetical protein
MSIKWISYSSPPRDAHAVSAKKPVGFVDDHGDLGLKICFPSTLALFAKVGEHRYDALARTWRSRAAQSVCGISFDNPLHSGCGREPTRSMSLKEVHAYVLFRIAK